MFRDKVVLEIGCGLGLLSLVCASLGASAIATDSSRDSLRLAKKSADANADAVGGRVEFAQMLWGDTNNWSRIFGSRKPPDVLLACDVLYEPDCFPALMNTFQTAWKANPEALIILAFQRRDAELEDSFLESLGAGVRVMRMNAHTLFYVYSLILADSELDNSSVANEAI
jgi:predicted nicotinamide N-methyase